MGEVIKADFSQTPERGRIEEEAANTVGSLALGGEVHAEVEAAPVKELTLSELMTDLKERTVAELIAELEARLPAAASSYEEECTIQEIERLRGLL